MTTKLINLRDTGGTIPDDAVVIDRRSRWGNPYRIGPGSTWTRKEVVWQYWFWLRNQLADGTLTRDDLAGLAGWKLACWCTPKMCHGDVLVRAADAATDDGDWTEWSFEEWSDYHGKRV